MGKLISIWEFICRRKYLITIVAFAVIIVFLDENSLLRRLGYERFFNRKNLLSKKALSCLIIIQNTKKQPIKLKKANKYDIINR